MGGPVDALIVRDNGTRHLANCAPYRNSRSNGHRAGFIWEKRLVGPSSLLLRDSEFSKVEVEAGLVDHPHRAESGRVSFGALRHRGGLWTPSADHFGVREKVSSEFGSRKISCSLRTCIKWVFVSQRAEIRPNLGCRKD